MRAEYDALTVIPRKPYSNEAVLHNCQFQADLKTAFITHIHYGFDCVFPEDISNETVYAQTAQPLVQIAMNGGMATMFMFGQTGPEGPEGPGFAKSCFSFFPEQSSRVLRNLQKLGIPNSQLFTSRGSGKTFTMTAIEDFAARDLFANKVEAENEGQGEDFLSLQFYELRGNRCFDLLVTWHQTIIKCG